MIGTTISRYRITARLGQGGMGEVYLAEDTHLQREVALKFLPDDLAANDEMLARFAREARVLASLSHPNLAVVHGLETADGRQFIVMERVEGETLAARLARGRMKPSEALRICEQIAAGLESAHERNIVHRDLKPSNVMISPEGRVKILDFGLAKAQRGNFVDGDESRTVTLTAAMTLPGAMLGTAPYMSPEQVAGRPVDRRTDNWAFGCVLFECLAGRRPFPGPSLTELVAEILERDPDWDALPATTPAKIRALIHRCLAKDPAQRQRDMGDARLEIAECLEQAPDLAAPPRRLPRATMVALAVVILVGGGWLGHLITDRGKRGPIAPLVSSTIELEPGYRLDGFRFRVDLGRPTRTAFTLSSDASFIVYSAALDDSLASESTPRLYLRRLDRPEAHPIAGTEGGIAPFLSHDDRWVGFWADGTLQKVPIAGGAATVLCEAPWPLGASWSSDGFIVFSSLADGGLCRVSQEGGPFEILTHPDPARGEGHHRLPFCLPGGEAVVFTVMRSTAGDTEPSIALLRTGTGEWETLITDAADARYVPTGHLVFLRSGTLMAVRFDLDALQTIGQPVAFIEDVSQALSGRHSGFNTAAGQYAISRSAWLLYARGGVVPELQNQLVWVDQTGSETAAAMEPADFLCARLAPDGQKVAYWTGHRIFVLDLESGARSPVTPDGMSFAFPVWSHDGSRLIFQNSHGVLFWQPWDGSRAMEQLTNPETSGGGCPNSVSPDGRFVAMALGHGDTGRDIDILDLDSGSVTPFISEPGEQAYAAFSPDGKLIAYTSDDTGRREVYVQPYPDRQWKRQISVQGGSEPLWSHDGKKLFYRSAKQVWVAEAQPEGNIGWGRARLLFETTGLQRCEPSRAWDLSPDSERFLMTRLDPRKPDPLKQLVLVQNWGAELERLLPAQTSGGPSR